MIKKIDALSRPDIFKKYEGKDSKEIKKNGIVHVFNEDFSISAIAEEFEWYPYDTRTMFNLKKDIISRSDLWEGCSMWKIHLIENKKLLEFFELVEAFPYWITKENLKKFLESHISEHNSKTDFNRFENLDI